MARRKWLIPAPQLLVLIKTPPSGENQILFLLFGRNQALFWLQSDRGHLNPNQTRLLGIWSWELPVERYPESGASRLFWVSLTDSAPTAAGKWEFQFVRNNHAGFAFGVGTILQTSGWFFFLFENWKLFGELLLVRNFTTYLWYGLRRKDFFRSGKHRTKATGEVFKYQQNVYSVRVCVLRGHKNETWKCFILGLGAVPRTRG